MVQLNPSTKRDTRGRAVESNSSYWLVGGGCTWSNVKTCFLGVDATETSADGAPAPAKALEGDSIDTEVEEAACITERWNRAGIEVESWVVEGRIRRAVKSQKYITVVSTVQTYQLEPRSPLRTTSSRGPWLLFSPFESPQFHTNLLFRHMPDFVIF